VVSERLIGLRRGVLTSRPNCPQHDGRVTFFSFVREFWHKLQEVPFKRERVVGLMTPHFGVEGATEYVAGLRSFSLNKAAS
jgi:hypothetical protein